MSPSVFPLAFLGSMHLEFDLSQVSSSGGGGEMSLFLHEPYNWRAVQGRWTRGISQVDIRPGT